MYVVATIAAPTIHPPGGARLVTLHYPPRQAAYGIPYTRPSTQPKVRGRWIDPALGKVKFDDWAGRWMATTVHLKPKTRYDYRSLLRRHVVPMFGDLELTRIDRLAVRTWIADLEASGLSASRIRQARQVLSSAMAAAVESGLIAANPASGVKVPRVRPKEKAVPFRRTGRGPRRCHR
ncbi:MAG: tyrosine recombinase XerC [Acidimicrobiia bacterium]